MRDKIRHWFKELFFGWVPGDYDGASAGVSAKNSRLTINAYGCKKCK